jgi:SH3 domain-containing YSC84-like protein 1
MRIQIIAGVALLLFGATSSSEAALKQSQMARLDNATAVLRSTGADMRTHARCIAVIPASKRMALRFGAEYGKGVMTCRQGDLWSSPVFVQLGRINVGPQIGVKQTDLVLLIMNDHGVRRLLDDKITLGVDASVAAGPLGRDLEASTDGQATAEILAYSRAQGVYAGVSLQGGILKPDPDANEDLYGRVIEPREILLGPIAGTSTAAQSTRNLPAVAENFVREASTSADEKSLAQRDLQTAKKVATEITKKNDEKNEADTNSTEDRQASTAANHSALDRDAMLQKLDRMETTVDRLERVAPDTSTPVGTTGSDDTSNTRTKQIRELRQQIESLRQQLRNQQQ